MRKQPKRVKQAGVDEYGRTPLHNTIVQIYDPVNIAAVVRLVGDGADPNAADDNGFTPLHFAAQESLPEVTQFLLQAGANPNAQDIFGNVPLFRAVMSGRSIAVVKMLLDAGADPRIRTSRLGKESAT